MIEKIKLYCDRNKLKKIKLFTFPIIISSVILTGCSIKNTSSSKTNDTLVNYETNIDHIDEIDNFEIQSSIDEQFQNSIIEESIEEIPYNQIQVMDTYIELSDEDLIYIKDKLDEPVEYQYSEYFEVPQALEKYEQFEEKETISNIIINNNIVDVNKLYEIILKNNNSFLNEGVNNSIFKKFADRELKEVCNIIAENLNKKIEELSIDVNELDSVLCNLKILSYEKYEYAAITEDGCLAINKDMINTLNVENAFEKIITHETMHLIQKSSQEEQDLEGYSKNVGMNYMWEDLKVNSLYNDWLIEAVAEKSASFITGQEINYQKKIAYLDALEIATAFDNVSITNIDLSKDLNKFYEIFMCNGLISKEEIATMMYAIDFINTDDMLTTEENEFLTNYKNTTGNELFYREQQDLRKTYIGTIYKTLAKKLYYDLTRKLNEGSITITDAFSIIVLFETSCSKNTWYSLDERLQYNESFIRDYYELQSYFFEIIGNKAGFDKEYVQRAYNSYNNYDILIDFTNKDTMLNDIYSKIKQNKSISINQMYNKISNKKTY